MGKRQDYYVYQPKNTRYWWIYYTHPGTKERIRHTLGTTIKPLAIEAARVECQSAYEQAKTGAKVAWTIGELLDWAKDLLWKNKVEPRKLESELKPLYLHLGKSVAATTKIDEILRFRTKILETGISIESVKKPLNYLGSAYEAAILSEYLLTNPVRLAKKKFKQLFPRTKGRMKFLNHPQMRLLLEAASGILRAIIFVALRTGMRRGEILRLGWNDINNDMTYLRTWSQKGANAEKKERDVPIMPDLRRLIDSLPRHGKTVFAYAEDGMPLSKSGVVKSSYRRLVDRLASKDACFEGFTFHDLRHTFVSEMLGLGANIDWVGKIVGHSHTEMTEHYGHLDKSKLFNEMGRLPILDFNLPELSIGNGNYEANVVKIADSQASAVSSVGRVSP